MARKAHWIVFTLCLGLFGSLSACDNRVADGTCLDAEDCESGFCRAGVCAPCGLDLDCGSAGVCRGGVCEGGLPPAPEFTDNGGVLVFSPDGPVDFGTPVVGVSVERIVAVLNFGDEAFVIEDISVGPSEFSLLNTALPATLNPGDRLELTFAYSNDDDTADTGAATLRTTAGACDPACADPSSVELPLVSAFTGGDANLAVAPLALDFGNIAPVQQSLERSVILRNDAGADVLRVTGLAVAGDAGQFDVDAPAPPFFLGPGESLSVPVRYTPSVAGAHAAQIAITAESTDPAARSFFVQLTGNSAAANALSFDPPAIAFPTVQQVTQRTSTLTNNSGAAVNIASLDAQGVGFSAFASVAMPYTIAPGASIEVFVDYDGTGGAAPNGTVTAADAQLALTADAGAAGGFTSVEVVSGPEDNVLTDNCLCQATGNIPAANVDLVYSGSGATCSKPANVSCGINGGTCSCDTMGAFGEIGWGSGRTEEVRGQTWIVDERITHSGVGQDGVFTARVDLLDDCLAVPGSTSYGVNHSCCFLDCEEQGQQCYPYGAAPLCASECEFFASQATSQDCLQRGPITIRTTVTLSGQGTEVREFCTTLNASGASANVVNIERTGGAFSVGQVQAGSIEVAPGQPCQ